MKPAILPILLLVALAAGPEAGAAPPESGGAKKAEEKDIRFHWAFGALVKTGDGRSVVPVGERTVLRSGDRLKMILKLQKDCFAYVLLHGPKDEIRLLFPYSLKQFDSDYHVDREYPIPQGRAWFELDKEVGIERFHLIASKERLHRLEALLKEYESVRSPQKETLAERILSEMRSMEKGRRDLRSFAERPLQIVGRTRGAGDDQEDLLSTAVEVSAKGFFSRTFTIDHRP